MTLSSNDLHLLSVATSGDYGHGDNSVNSQDVVTCPKRFNRKMTLEKCLEDYVSANAHRGGATRLCYKCAHGRRRRDEYARGA